MGRAMPHSWNSMQNKKDNIFIRVFDARTFFASTSKLNRLSYLHFHPHTRIELPKINY
jgi:hypothetical protein